MSARRRRRPPARRIRLDRPVKPVKPAAGQRLIYVCPAPLPGRRRGGRAELCGVPLPCTDHGVDNHVDGLHTYGSVLLSPTSATLSAQECTQQEQ